MLLGFVALLLLPAQEVDITRDALIEKYAGIGVGTIFEVGNTRSSPETTAFAFPASITRDSDGNFYVADTANDRVAKISCECLSNDCQSICQMMPDGQECTNGEISSSCGWLVSTFLGNYSRGTVDSRKVLLSPEVSSRRRPAEATDQASAGAPLEPTLRFPEYVIADGRTLYISDVGNSQVLRVSVNASAVPPQYSVDVVAGIRGQRGGSGDCGPSTLAKLRFPRGLAFLPSLTEGPQLVIADSGNDAIRQVELRDWPSCMKQTGNYTERLSRYGTLVPPDFGDACKGNDLPLATDPPILGLKYYARDDCAFQCAKLPKCDLWIWDLNGTAGSGNCTLRQCSPPGPEDADILREIRFNRSYCAKTGRTPADCTILPWTDPSSTFEYGRCRTPDDPGAVNCCRPGVIVNLAGTRNIEDQQGKAARFQYESLTRRMHRLIVSLSNPHGLAVDYSSKELPVYITDTGQNRLLYVPTMPYTVYETHFWLLISGPDAVRVTSDPVKGVGGLEQTLQQILNAGSLRFSPTKFSGANHEQKILAAEEITFDHCVLALYTEDDTGTRTKKPMDSFSLEDSSTLETMSCYDRCNPTNNGDHLLKYAYEYSNTVDFPLMKFCQETVCEIYREDDTDCAVNNQTKFCQCEQVCHKGCFKPCFLKMLALESAASSDDICMAYLQLQQCLEDLTVAQHCPPIEVFLTLTTAIGKIRAGIDADGRDARVRNFCMNWRNETYEAAHNARCQGCDWCDCGVGRILGAETEYNKPPRTYTIGLLYKVQSPQMLAREIGAALANLTQDRCLEPDCPRNVWRGKRMTKTALDTLRSSAFFDSNVDVNVEISSRFGHAFSRSMDFNLEFRVQPGDAWWKYGTGEAGTSEAEAAGEEEIASNAMFDGPRGLAVDKGGLVYVADTRKNTIRRINPVMNTITTLAGSGMAHDLGDGALARQAALRAPVSPFLDDQGNLYIADQGNHRLRQVNGLVVPNARCPKYEEYYNRAVNPLVSDLTSRITKIENRADLIRRSFFQLAKDCVDCSKADHARCGSDAAISYCASPHVPYLDLEQWCGKCALRQTYDARLPCRRDDNDVYEVLCVKIDPENRALTALDDPVEGCKNPGLPPCVGDNRASCCSAASDIVSFLCCGALRRDGSLPIGQYFQDMRREQRLIAETTRDLRESGRWTSDRGLLMNLTRDNEVVAIQERICSGRFSALAVVYAWQEWYLSVTQTPDKTKPPAERNGCTDFSDISLIGPRFYHEPSSLPVRVVDGFVDRVPTPGWDGVAHGGNRCPVGCDFLHPENCNVTEYRTECDLCHPGCGFHHPDLEEGNRDCCGMGYPCGENEGNCASTSDCMPGLVCGYANCPWSTSTNEHLNDNCCRRPSVADYLRDFRKEAITLGFNRALVLSEVVSTQLLLNLDCTDKPSFLDSGGRSCTAFKFPCEEDAAPYYAGETDIDQQISRLLDNCRFTCRTGDCIQLVWPDAHGRPLLR
jgi:hypothetical protein